eukprot:110006_1
MISFISYSKDEHKQLLLSNNIDQHVSKMFQSKFVIIFSIIILYFGVIVSVIILNKNNVSRTNQYNVDTMFLGNNFTYRGSEILALLSQGENSINNETFALPLKSYNKGYEKKLFTSLYDAIVNNDILSLLEIDKPIYGQYPNIPDNKCQLLLHNISFTAKNDKLQNQMAAIFADIIELSMKNYKIDFNFTRFDLFHGHFFYNSDIEVSGILFHAMEYPQLSSSFPYPLGFCQQDSTCIFNRYYWSFRNILLLMSNSKYARGDGKHKHKDKSHKKKINTNMWLLNTSNNSYISINIMQPYAFTIFVDDIGEEVGELYDFSDTQVLWQAFQTIQ